MIHTIGVLGLGVFGSTVAKELGMNNHNVIAIDKNEANINRIETYISKGIIGDFTNIELLKQVGIGQCDKVIIASGRSLEASALAILHLKKLGVQSIYAKSKNHDYMDVMLELGANHVIRPEYEMGVRTARRLMKENIIDLVELDDSLSFVEFRLPKNWIGQTINQLKLRQKFDMNIIGVKHSVNGPIDYQVNPNDKLEHHSILLAIADTENLKKIRDLNKPKY